MEASSPNRLLKTRAAALGGRKLAGRWITLAESPSFCVVFFLGRSIRTGKANSSQTGCSSNGIRHCYRPVRPCKGCLKR